MCWHKKCLYQYRFLVKQIYTYISYAVSNCHWGCITQNPLLSFSFFQSPPFHHSNPLFHHSLRSFSYSTNPSITGSTPWSSSLTSTLRMVLLTPTLTVPLFNILVWIDAGCSGTQRSNSPRHKWAAHLFELFGGKFELFVLWMIAKGSDTALVHCRNWTQFYKW